MGRAFEHPHGRESYLAIHEQTGLSANQMLFGVLVTGLVGVLQSRVLENCQGSKKTGFGGCLPKPVFFDALYP